MKQESLFSKCPLHWKFTDVKNAVKRHGWKPFAAFFAFYLVRDVTIYLVLPYLFLASK